MRCLYSALNLRRRPFSGTSMEDRTTSAWVVTRTFVLALYTKFHPTDCLTFVGREGTMIPVPDASSAPLHPTQLRLRIQRRRRCHPRSCPTRSSQDVFHGW